MTFGFHTTSIDEKIKNFPKYLWDESDVIAMQTLEQVWFAGVHTDVGGWYDDCGLENISLHWMLKKQYQAAFKLILMSSNNIGRILMMYSMKSAKDFGSLEGYIKEKSVMIL